LLSPSSIIINYIVSGPGPRPVLDWSLQGPRLPPSVIRNQAE
jgi:hypothetical protein